MQYTYDGERRGYVTNNIRKKQRKLFGIWRCANSQHWGSFLPIALIARSQQVATEDCL